MSFSKEDIKHFYTLDSGEMKLCGYESNIATLDNNKNSHITKT